MTSENKERDEILEEETVEAETAAIACAPS